MTKIDVFFTKSNSIWSKLISFYYKIFHKKETSYTHCGLLIDNKIFEIDISKKSGFYERELGKYYKINCGYINDAECKIVLDKYTGVTYDLGEIAKLLGNSNHSDIDNKFICSTLVAYILKELNILKKYNYKTISPDEVFVLIKENFKEK